MDFIQHDTSSQLVSSGSMKADMRLILRLRCYLQVRNVMVDYHEHRGNCIHTVYPQPRFFLISLPGRRKLGVGVV